MAIVVLAAGWVMAAGAVCAGEEATPAEAVKRPGSIEALAERAQSLMQERKWEEARGALEEALKLAPSNEVVRFGLASAYIKLGRWREARDILRRLVSDLPDNPGVKNNLAWVLARAKDSEVRDPAKAVRYAQDALLAFPGDYNVWGTLAESYYASERYDRAVRLARIAFRMAMAARAQDLGEVQSLYVRCREAAGVTEEAEPRGPTLGRSVPYRPAVTQEE